MRYFIECECKHCGAPTGSGFYEVSKERFDKTNGEPHRGTSNITQHEADWLLGEHVDVDAIMCKTVFGECMECRSSF